METEKLFGINVPDDLAAKTETVGQFVNLIYELRLISDKPISYDEILLQRRQMISKNFALPMERIIPEASFTKDLGLD